MIFLDQRENIANTCKIKIFDLEENRLFIRTCSLRIIQSLKGMSQNSCGNSLYLCGSNNNSSSCFLIHFNLEATDIKTEVLDKNNIEWCETKDIEEYIDKLDVLYMTRVQKERFFNEADYIRLKDYYILNKEKMEKAKKDMIVLHPLPRVNEIAKEVDEDERALYFKQAQYGRFIRMALILKLLGIK